MTHAHVFMAIMQARAAPWPPPCRHVSCRLGAPALTMLARIPPALRRFELQVAKGPGLRPQVFLFALVIVKDQLLRCFDKVGPWQKPETSGVDTKNVSSPPLSTTESLILKKLTGTRLRCPPGALVRAQRPQTRPRPMKAEGLSGLPHSARAELPSPCSASSRYAPKCCNLIGQTMAMIVGLSGYQLFKGEENIICRACCT